MATDITEDTIRAFGLQHGLVDVKVCAVSDVWSGLKLVVPVSKMILFGERYDDRECTSPAQYAFGPDGFHDELPPWFLHKNPNPKPFTLCTLPVWAGKIFKMRLMVSLLRCHYPRCGS